jgi:Mg/Co/Ni transporter MgtE
MEKSSGTHLRCLKGTLAVSLGLWMIMLWLVPVKVIATLLVVLITAIVIAAVMPVIAHAVQEHGYAGEERRGAVR